MEDTDQHINLYLHLELDTVGKQFSQNTGTNISLRPLRPDEAALLTHLQNRCFADAWEFNPNSVAEIAHAMAAPFASPQDIWLVGDGDRVIGYCWTGHFPGMGGQTGKGQVFMLGVDPEYLGQGIGRTVLLAGIAHLTGKGARTIELTVDSQNTAARSLYQSLGFQERGGTVWYEWTLD